jgi:hypothetical protein
LLKTKTKTATAKPVAQKPESEPLVPSAHFHRHESFAIGPEQNTVNCWHSAIIGAIASLDAREVETYDCALYRFKVNEEGLLVLAIERHITKPRTIVSGFKGQQQGSGKSVTDYTVVDSAFELNGDGLQLPEPMLRQAIEAWANAHRRRLSGYELLQLSRAFSLLIAARHGCQLGLTDL